MIGVFLTRRRREFLEFVSHNPIDYQEILDVSDTNSLSLYEAIYADGSAIFAEPFSVIDISAGDFYEVFAKYIKKHKPEKIYPEELFYSALFYYYKQTQCGCLQTFIPPVQDTHATFENKSTELPIHKVSVEKTSQDEDALSSLVDDVDAKPNFHADLTKTNLHASLEKPPIPEPVPIQNDEQVIEEQPMQSHVFTENPQPQKQQFQARQPMSQGYSQQEYGYVPPNSQTVNPYDYQQPQPQPVQGYGGYQQPIGINPFGTPITPAMQIAPAGYNPLTVQQPAPPAQRMPVRTGGVPQVRRRGSGTHKRIGAPIITFSSLTDKAGTTTVAYLLAKAMASNSPDMKIIYLDLNISNPNTIANLLGTCGCTDASIVNIATSNEIDFASNLSILTDTIAAGEGSFSMITFGEATFRQKTGFSAIDYNQFLAILADNFDLVLADIGKLQGTMPYQQLLLSSNNAKHILVADGSSVRLVNNFISNAQGLLHGFEIVVNKSAPAVGTFTFSRVMHITPLAAIGYHNNTARFITDAMSFDGTALQHELCMLGGAL